MVVGLGSAGIWADERGGGGGLVGAQLAFLCSCFMSTLIAGPALYRSGTGA